MSCFSRLLGLICAIVPGLFFVAFSVRFFQFWPTLGGFIGPLYSLLSLITGATCLYLGVNILLGGNRSEETPAPEIASEPAPIAREIADAPEPEPLRAAPLPVNETAPAEVADAQVTSAEIVDVPDASPNLSSQSVFAAPSEPLAPLDTATLRIRELVVARPGWRATAPQMAHLANLNMGVADAAARQMVSKGEAQMEIGPHGETIYSFDLPNKNQ